MAKIQSQQPIREIQPADLKGLAHPVRTAIYDALSKYGQQTATTLAQRLGESTGSTSYHLRQLARHNFIREVDGTSGGRQKWWERIPGAVTVPSKDAADPSATAAAEFIRREWTRSSARALEDFVSVLSDEDRLSPEWLEAADMTTSNLHLTPEQLAEITARFHAQTQTLIDEYRGRNDPRSRPVQIQFNAFPLIDGEELPS